MYLKELKLKNFRCYEDLEINNIGKLAVFIGENDAGKTVLLKAIQWLLSEKPCEDDDCRKDKNGDISVETSVEGSFKIEKGFDTLEEKYFTNDNSKIFRIKKVHTAGDTRIFYFRRGYSDARFNDFTGAEKQRKLLSEYGLKPAKNEIDRKKQRDELVRNGKIHYGEDKPKEISPLNYKKHWKEHLPNVRFVSAANYKSADDIIQSKLRDLARGLLDSKTADEELKPYIESLEKVKRIIKKKLKGEIDNIEKTLKKYHQGIKDVNAEIEINFEDAAGASALMLNLGDGERPLEQFGDGTKRRLWMGLLEWETEIKSEKSSRSVIRLYDEPDVNLHYRAQQQFFENINELTKNTDTHTQCFLSTHSFSMVDRAPSESLVLIRVNDRGEREKSQLQSLPQNDDYFDFMRDLAKAGLSNSALLYESGFLLVEGESEEFAMPILYQTLFQRTLAQDGIKLINMQGCGNWEGILGTLLETRKNEVHLLLDSDCQKIKSNGNEKKRSITPKSLEKLGLEGNFIEKQVTLIGENEFEDAFDDDVLIATLKNKYSEVDNEIWQSLDLAALRQEEKFSEVFVSKVSKITFEFLGYGESKPKFAMALARQCSKEQIPPKIIEAFNLLRSRIRT
jgi:predicted ATP-dependent endonuclease of OLD family